MLAAVGSDSVEIWHIKQVCELHLRVLVETIMPLLPKCHIHMPTVASVCITPAVVDGQHTLRLCVEVCGEAYIFVADLLVASAWRLQFCPGM